MFEGIVNFFKKIGKQDKEQVKSKDAAKERLHLVLMQDRANVSADFLDLMKQEIIEVIKKYIDVDENAIDVRLTNKANTDGTTGAPALYANIPIVSIKEEVKSGMARQQDNINEKKQDKEEKKTENSVDTKNVKEDETKAEATIEQKEPEAEEQKEIEEKVEQKEDIKEEEESKEEEKIEENKEEPESEETAKK